MDVSIVIVNYRVKDLVLQTLKSIYSFSPSSISFEVIVIDNHSDDGSVEEIISLFPLVILIANEHNEGFPAANNQGFRLTRGEYIFMLNPDTEFIEDTLSKLVEFMRTHQEYDLIAPKLLNSDRSHQLSTWRFPSVFSVVGELFSIPLLTRRKNYYKQNFDLPFEPQSLSGAALFFRRSVFDSVGMLDETLFWIEDIDFCYRLEKMGLRKYYLPQAEVVHHSGQSAKKNYNISISNQVYNKIKFFNKHYGRGRTFFIMIVSAFYCILRFIVFGFLSPINITYRLKSQAYIYTLKRIFNPPSGIQ